MIKVNAHVVIFSHVDLLLEYRIKEVDAHEFSRIMLTPEKMKELSMADIAIFKDKKRGMVVIKSRY